jgi:hypothetical protein
MFDRVNDYVDIPSAVVSGFPKSMCAWFKQTTLAWQTIIVIKQDDGVSWDHRISLDLNSSGNVTAHAKAGGSDENATSNVTAPAGEWHHACAVFTSTSERTIYVDGGNAVTDTGAASPNTPTVTRIGVKVVAANEDYFGGTLDDVRIYNRALSAAEIKRLYKIGGTMVVNKAANSGSLSNGLVGYWSFDGQDMSRKNNMALDRSGQGNHGTITNGATTTAGKIGQAMQFDGVDPDYVAIGGHFGFPANISVAGWVNIDQTEADECEMISLGDNVALRILSGDTSGYFYDGTTWRSTT